MGPRVWALGALGLLTACSAAETQDLEQFRLRVSADRLTFGELAVGEAGEEALRVTNESSVPVTLTVVAGDDYDEDFDFTPATAALGPDQTTTVLVTYTPSRSGMATSTLLLRADDARIDPLPVTLTGAGVGGCEDLSVTPNRVDFGAVVLGTQGAATLTLRNAGAGPLTAIVEEGDNVGDCDGASGEVTDFCLRTAGVVTSLGRVEVPGEGEVALGLEFDPAVLGSATGFLSIRAQAACPATPVPLGGAAVDNGLSCTDRVSFETVFPGTCRTETITCTNEASAPTTIVDWGRRPGSSQPSALRVADFEGPRTLAQGEAVSFDVEYCPERLGPLTAEVGVEQADGPRIDVPVVGRSGGPRLVASPATIDFGQVAVLAPARAQVTLTNEGFDPLEITRVAFDSMDLRTEATALVLEPSESETLDVELTAFTAGRFAATLQLSSNDVGAPTVEVPIVAEVLNLPNCAFRVASVIEHGVVEVGRTAYRTVAVENIGGGDCLLTGARLLPGADPEVFLPDAFTGSRRIPPGDLFPIRVGYAPTSAGMHSARLEVALSSRSQPFSAVPIEGQAVDRGPYAYPQRLDFTEVDAQCSGLTRTVRIRNDGSQPWTGLQAAFTSANVPGFSLGMEALPPTLSPGQSATLTVRFAPPRDGRFANALRVFGSQGGQSVSVIADLVGARTAAPEVQESFTQVSGQPVDVLLIADWISRVPLQSLLPAGLDALTGFFEAQDVHWHVGVASPYRNEAGRLVSAGPMQSVLRRGDPGVNNAYDQILRATLPSSQFNTLFDFLATIREATSAPMLDMANRGFLRRDARLGIVMLTRRTDQSQISPELAVEHAFRTKGYDRRNEVRVHAVAGPTGSTCLGSQAAPRLEQAVALAGGRFEPFCDNNIADALVTLSQDIAGRQDTFFLRAAPAPGSLEVRVDGAPVPAMATGGGVNWTYEPTRGLIRFAPASVPDIGAVIDLRYTPACG